jgi:PAS domain S-box-containing protein
MSGAELVLNVDDYGPGRYVRTKVLRQAGFEVLEAASGEEALAITRTARPHLLLLDVDLPDVSGYEVCRRIKVDPELQTTAVLHLTAAFRLGRDHARALDLGADGYLVEPVDPDVLVATVRSLLRAQRAEHAVRTAAVEWQATFDAIGDGVGLLDAEGRIVRHNAVLRGLVGAVHDVHGRPFTDVVAGWLHPADVERCAAALGAGKPAVVELQVGHRHLEIDLEPVASEDVRSGIVVVVRDISERKRVEQIEAELLESERAARASAEEANRAKDDFLAVLSHELRTPLAAMLGWVRLLGSRRLDAEASARALEVIDRNIRLQSQLVEDLLDVSRIVSGKLRIEVGPVDTRAIIGSAVDAAAATAAARRIRLDVSGGDVGSVMGDAARLGQVLNNLLSNAMKFTPAGGSVRLHAERAGGRVRIAVQDTGQGIESSLLPHIFDRFRQGEGASQRSHTGLGLGLAIVRHVVELHGGVVAVHSEGIGHGATFTVELPAAEAAAEPAPRQDGALVFGEDRSLRGVRVLVVEDDDDTRGMLAAVLREGGADVRAEPGVGAALGAMSEYRPHVLVSDIGMPDGNGYELIGRVRRMGAARAASVRAVALTAFAGQADAEEALKAGFDRYLAKPVEPATLMTVIAELLHR